MKKRSKKQSREPSKQANKASAEPIAESLATAEVHPPKYRFRGLMLMFLICGYWLLFYAAQPARLIYWQLLLLPDVIFQHWTNDAGTISLLDRVPIWFVSFWWMGMAYAAGSGLLRLLKIPAITKMEWCVFATSLGLSALSLFTLLAGLCGMLQMQAMFLLLALILPAMEIWRVWQERKEISTAEVNEWPSRWFWIAIVPLTVLYLLAGVLPPMDFDVREYHLQVPKEWFQAGRIHFLPHNVYGNMPLGAEMHALGCMELWLGSDAWWYGALAGKQVIALFTPLTALALWCAGKRFYNAACGTLAAVVYLSFPWIAHVSFHGLIDGVVAHYAFLAFYAAMLTGTSRQTYLLTGLFAGSAAACKYPAVVFVVMPVMIMLLSRVWQTSEAAQRNRNLCVSLAMYLIACAVSGGTWYAKNAYFTGNPVYPLAGNLFGGATRTPEKITQWEKAHAVPRDANGNRYSAQQAFDSVRNVLVRSQWLSPILWPLVLMGILLNWRTNVGRGLIFFSLWIFAIWWCVTHRIDRFWLPAMPMLALLAGSAWLWANDRRTRGYILGSVAISVLFCVLMMISPVAINSRDGWSLGPSALLTSLHQIRTNLEYEQISKPHAQLNSVALADEAVLLVGDAVPFDLNMPVFYNTCFDDDILESLARNRTTAELRQALRERKITYVLVDWKELRRYRGAGNYGYSDYIQPRLFQQLVKANVLVSRWKDDSQHRVGWEIYEVK